MTDSPSRRFDHRCSRAGLAFLFVLVCVVLVPDGFFWTGPLAAGLAGLTLAAGLALGRRAISSRPQPITVIEAEPARTAVAPPRIVGPWRSASPPVKGD
jgi:hypothetical protein